MWEPFYEEQFGRTSADFFTVMQLEKHLLSSLTLVYMSHLSYQESTPKKNSNQSKTAHLDT